MSNSVNKSNYTKLKVDLKFYFDKLLLFIISKVRETDRSRVTEPSFWLALGIVLRLRHDLNGVYRRTLLEHLSRKWVSKLIVPGLSLMRSVAVLSGHYRGKQIHLSTGVSWYACCPNSYAPVVNLNSFKF